MIGAWIKNHKLIVVIILVAALVFIFSNQSNGLDYQQYEVTREEVVDAVELTGRVSAVDRANLGFNSSGEVSAVLVQTGDEIRRGDIIARLNTGALAAELARADGGVDSALASIASANAGLEQAQANLASVKASNSGVLTNLESARNSLDTIIEEQDQLVENATRNLLNNNLQAYPINASRNLPQPQISGSYNSDQEGSYQLDFYRSGSGTGYSARFTGLESGTVSFPDFNLPVALGDRGLFVSLPQTNQSYTFTDFTIPIPNVRSSSYQTAINSLEASIATRTRLISAAQNEVNRLESQETGLDSLTTAEERRAAASVESARAGLASAQAGLTQARAAKAIVESQIQDRILRAPFSGTIAQIDLQVGETASTAETAAVLVSEGDYEIELQVPEIDIARIQEGMSALITLDAYDDAFTWNGEVVSIEDIETSVEGVPVYITTVRVTNPTDRIKIGMNARAMIVLDQIDDTVAIPQSYLFTEDSRNYVLQQIDDDRVVEKTVKTGLRGANSLVQITAGLEAGEIIVREQQSD